MSKFYFLFVFLIFVSVNLQSQTNHLPGEIIVQFHEKTTPDAVANRYREINGMETKIIEVKLLSEPFNMYKISLDPESGNDYWFLRALKSDREVSIAQFNHYVYPRETIPNDPLFDTQWYHVNDGTNGLEDADIDSDLAWDITTGGLTALGDTIVVCVIEGGNLQHVDLIDNAWFNHGEIPGNGIDDDGNGYIDDYRGWNVESESDNGVYSGGHGTQVMGMIGAKGNNETGVAGINWDIKIMSVAGENLMNEASIVAAYTYPLVQRKIYNATQGESGAFVVVTNASWGLDGASPEDYPIWTAIYDTLGVHGILNCGSTSNNNVNVDIVGDLPTSVPSDYMIGVTASNRFDVRTFAGFGANTIELAAPGENVRTTSGSSGTTTTTGTSFAAPLTAGVIALLYAVPCTDFSQMVKNNPQLGADYVRYALLNGVDPVENLQNETKTGGRLNAYNSLSIMLDDCENDFCLPVFALNHQIENDSIVKIHWNASQDTTVTLRYRQLDTEEWFYVENIDTTFFKIDSLIFCTDYEFQAASDCSQNADGDLNFTASLTFQNVGCCEAPTEYDAQNITHTQAELLWQPAFNIPEYEIFFKEIEEEIWQYAGMSSTGIFEIAQLDTCTLYEFLIKPACVEGFDVGAQITVRTKGCGACLDLDYCDSKGKDTGDEFIKKVTIGDYENDSGNNGGYMFFEDSEIQLELGAQYPIVINPGFSFFPYNENYRVWIDFNQDGVFDNDEVVFQTANSTTTQVSGNITIPNDLPLGTTRLRVAMMYAGFNNSKPTACGTFNYGEVEDYCVNIILSSSVKAIEFENDFSLFPNPSKGSFTLNTGSVHNARNIQISDIAGKVVFQSKISSGENIIKTSLAAGVYNVSLTAKDHTILGVQKLIIAH